MVDRYIQEVETATPTKYGVMHFIGTLVELAAVGLILAAVFFSYYLFIAVGVLLVVGIALNQSYNGRPKKYQYAINSARLVVSVESQLGKRARKLELLLCDVVDSAQFADILNRDDLDYSLDSRQAGVFAVTFKTSDGTLRRMLWSPDDYMQVLFAEFLEQSKAEKSAVSAEKSASTAENIVAETSTPENNLKVEKETILTAQSASTAENIAAGAATYKAEKSDDGVQNTDENRADSCVVECEEKE